MAVSLPIITEFDGSGVKKAIRQFQELEGAGAKANFALKKAAVPAVAAIGGLALALGDATKAAMEDQASQDQLALMLHNTAGASRAQIAATEEYIAKMAQAGAVTDDELRPAMEALVRGTKDVTEAQDLLGLAMDVSRGTGMDLTSVSDALAKAYQGNFKALRSLSPEMANMIKEGADLNEVIDVLGGTYGGSYATYAASAEGQTANFANSIGEAKEAVGAALLPALEQVLPYLQQMADWAQANPKAFLIIAGVIGGIAAAIVVANTAIKLWNIATTVATGIQWLFNAALTANPIGLVIVAIGALIAAVVIAYNKFDWFRTGVQKSMDVIKSLFDAYLSAYKWVFNQIAKLWNNTIGKINFKVPDWVPLVGGKSFSVPQIPMFSDSEQAARAMPNVPKMADGGIVKSPTLALIGERGPEAVVPLSKGRGMGGGSVEINIYSTVADASLPEKLVQALRDYNRTNGPLRVQVA